MGRGGGAIKGLYRDNAEIILGIRFSCLWCTVGVVRIRVYGWICNRGLWGTGCSKQQ